VAVFRCISHPVPRLVPSSADSLYLPVGRAEATHVERGSRFVAIVESASSIDVGLQLRERRRKEMHDASHHALAIRLADGATRYDDAGEPSGTAGRPILAVLEGAELVDAACVVTRYFGGTKLGTGGLARAYGQAASSAVEQLARRRVQQAEIHRVRYSFDDTGLVARTLATHGVARDGDEYGEVVHTSIRIPLGTAELLDRALRDATQGRAMLEACDEPELAWITLKA
jgi:putative IMPACT (imprinted ancient) family translation regulator